MNFKSVVFREFTPESLRRIEHYRKEEAERIATEQLEQQKLHEDDNDERRRMIKVPSINPNYSITTSTSLPEVHFSANQSINDVNDEELEFMQKDTTNTIRRVFELINHGMGEAVENSSVICCFMTPEYENSKNCQLELKRAQDLGKRIIACMVGDKNDRKWKPSGWLGLIIAGLTYINFRDDSDSNIRLRARELIDRIKNQPSTPAPEPLPQTVKLFEEIRQKYIRENRIKRMVNEEKSFPIEQSYINLAIVDAKDQQEKEKKLKEQDQKMKEREKQKDFNLEKQHGEIIGTYEEIYGHKTSIDVENIFQQCKDQIKKVLVLGRAGIGKSTFCQYVTYRWAKGELWSEYKLVILIRLRRLTDNRYPPRKEGKEYSLIDLVKKEYSPCEDLSAEQTQHFKELCKNRQVLWILDGYDEFAQNIPEQLKDVFDHVRETQHHILTSRPYAIKSSYDVKLEITGFTNDNIVKYVEQFFVQITKEINNDSSVTKKLLRLLKSNSSIWGVAHIPVNLELICSLWSNNDWTETTVLTITVLYDNIIEWQCKRHLARQNIEHKHMTKQAVYKRCDVELQFLERLAFKAMDYNKIMLTPAILIEAENDIGCCDVDLEQLLKMGILKSYDDKAIGTQNQTEKQHYFVHLSFQEHLAARHLLSILMSTDKVKATQFYQQQQIQPTFSLRLCFCIRSSLTISL
ncbi:unnamed protein product [Rotaria magnacalcarata]|uniref:NACHT domain-containing protein n=2 Tax=Rotaria magnacalcarata TaxID=392030 RepID=A0A816ZNM5_9BILA|nr:unnamed protein product [Rotaria magnacalcarata]